MTILERILLLTILNTHIQSEVLEDSINLMKRGLRFDEKAGIKKLSLQDTVVQNVEEAYEMLWYYWFLFDKKKHGSVQTTVHSVKVSDIALLDKKLITEKINKLNSILSQYGKEFGIIETIDQRDKVLDFFIKNQNQPQHLD